MSVTPVTLTVHFKVHFATALRGRKRIVAGEAPAPAVLVARIPRIARVMALAIKFEALLASGELKDYADIARFGHVTRARVTQIMNLLALALHVFMRMSKHDPQRGSRTTFVDRIVSNKIAHILENRHTQKRGGGRRIVPLDETNGAVPDGTFSAESVERDIDVRTAEASLPPDLYDIAILLAIHSPTDVARQLGLTRGQFRERQRAIREHFEIAGLNPFPNNQRKTDSGK